eukprot:COSAG04_NODE_15227_length_539_cov_0.722727_1_plen_64_part_10
MMPMLLAGLALLQPLSATPTAVAPPARAQLTSRPHPRLVVLGILFRSSSRSLPIRIRHSMASAV